MLHITGEIKYMREDGQVHSDICFTLENAKNEEARDFFHKSLDEWLDNQTETQLKDNKVNNAFYLMLSDHDH